MSALKSRVDWSLMPPEAQVAFDRDVQQDGIVEIMLTPNSKAWMPGGDGFIRILREGHAFSEYWDYFPDSGAWLLDPRLGDLHA